MADFDKAIPHILRHEGGFVSDPLDPGGATKYGISIRFLKKRGVPIPDADGDGVLSAGDVRFLPLERAIEIYKQYFWDAYRLDEVGPQLVAGKIFDMVVNTGVRGMILTQRAVNNRGWEPPLTEDGIMGPATLAALNTIPPERLLKEIKSEHLLFYKILVRGSPLLQRFMHGWEKRAAWPTEEIA